MYQFDNHCSKWKENPCVLGGRSQDTASLIAEGQDGVWGPGLEAAAKLREPCPVLYQDSKDL